MAKKFIRLSEEDKFDFIVVGIVCHLRDYRLSMALNKKLGINLSKQDEYTVFNNKRMEDQFFSFYEYLNEDEDRYNLICNKSQKGFLLPEQNQVDFLFLVSTTRMRLDESVLVATIKEIPIVLAAFKFDALKLKSRENLVF